MLKKWGHAEEKSLGSTDLSGPIDRLCLSLKLRLRAHVGRTGFTLPDMGHSSLLAHQASTVPELKSMMRVQHIQLCSTPQPEQQPVY